MIPRSAPGLRGRGLVSARAGPVVHAQRGRRRGLPGERARRARDPACASAVALAGVGQQRADRGRHRGGVAVGDRPGPASPTTSRSEELSKTATGVPGGHRLEWRQPEALVGGGEQQALAHLVQAAEVVLARRGRAGGRGRSGRHAPGCSVHGAGEIALGPGDDQARRRGGGAADAPPRRAGRCACAGRTCPPPGRSVPGSRNRRRSDAISASERGRWGDTALAGPRRCARGPPRRCAPGRRRSTATPRSPRRPVRNWRIGSARSRRIQGYSPRHHEGDEVVDGHHHRHGGTQRLAVFDGVVQVRRQDAQGAAHLEGVEQRVGRGG